MKHVVLQVLTEDLPRVSLELAKTGMFTPDYRPFEEDIFSHIPGEHYRELYQQASSRLEKIGKHILLDEHPWLGMTHVVSEQTLENTNDWLAQVWEHYSQFEENFHHLDAEVRLIDQLEDALDNFAELNIDLSLLQGEKQFLDIHLGMLPRGNTSQLREALSLAGYLLFVYMDHGNNSHVIVLGPKGKRTNEIASVLDTAGFRSLPIPPELHDKPDKLREELIDRRLNLQKQRLDESEAMEAFGDELRHRLAECQRILIMAEPFVLLDVAARSSGHLSVITGWIPAREKKHTERILKESLSNPFQLETRNPIRNERHLVPSYLPTNRLTAPFSTLVKQYGVPRYGEVDPTAIFALTFIVMFGMMFGDIGHGLTIVLVSWLARKKLKSFAVFAACTGLSASVFGVLYGSIFGYEEVFHAVWISPLSDPVYMLSVALAWGIGFLLLITLISIHNSLMEGEINRAIFDTNGVVSVILYLSVLGGIFNIYTKGSFGMLTALLSIMALLTLLSYKLIETHAPPGERTLVAAIETFETLTGYISNSLSFLRVAAFSLNHVALAIAVFTLADMMDGTGHWIMVICGNLFILILEGAIVTIQALRLEYYEGFSRFFAGDGQEFNPLKLDTGGST